MSYGKAQCSSAELSMRVCQLKSTAHGGTHGDIYKCSCSTRLERARLSPLSTAPRTWEVPMLRRTVALLGGLLVVSSTPILASAQASAPLAVEDCENCVDDDADGDVDRADGNCAPPSDGGGAGLGNAVAAYTLDK